MKISYMKKEQKDQYVSMFTYISKKEIENTEEILKFFNIMIPVLQQFDNKIVNQRLYKAINEEFAKHKSSRLKHYTPGPYTISTEFTGYRQYIKLDTYLLDRWIPELKQDIPSNSFCLEIPLTNERLVFANLEENIAKTRNQICVHIQELKTAIKQFPKAWEECAKISNAIEEFEDKYSYIIRYANGMVTFGQNFKY